MAYLRPGAVEPVYGNITCNKKLGRYTLRGKTKVGIQWILFCLAHNIGKIHRYGNENS
jgi:hypothetical protein